MHHTITWLAISAIILCTAADGCARATDYHVSPAGSDANPGTAAEPWQTIAKVNSTGLQPGDRVLFQGGETFAGTIELDADDSGADGNRIEIGSYGEGRATIDGGNHSGLSAKGCSHLAIENLNFVGSGSKAGNTKSGVFLVDGDDVVVDQIEVSGFRSSGLLLGGLRRARATHVYAHDNGADGISVGAGERPGERWSEDIALAYCIADNNPGDPSNLTNHSGNGIVVGCVTGCVVEYCEAMNNGWDMPRTGNGPVGIWAWSADRVVIQFCVAHDNKSPGADGGGFDLDGAVTNSIMQYNYSYNNMGPGYFLCQYPTAPEWKNNIVRYNISVNDGLKNNRRSGIDVYGGDERMSDAEVYNNTVYNNQGPAVGFGGLPAPRVRFRNNILVGAGELIAGDASPSRFEGNVYWLLGPDGTITGGHKTLERWAEATGQEMADGKLMGISADPLVIGGGTTPDIKPADLSKLAAYHLRNGSPCVGAGIPIAHNGGRDFWGKAVPKDAPPSIGACQGP